MGEILSQLFGEDAATIIRFLLALGVALLLFGLVIAFINSFIKRARRPKNVQSAPKTRLAVLEYIQIDENRTLVLVRHDNQEHLLMIGGSNDIVIKADAHRRQEAAHSPQNLPSSHEAAQNDTAQRPLSTASASAAQAVPASANLNSDQRETSSPSTPSQHTPQTPRQQSGGDIKSADMHKPTPSSSEPVSNEISHSLAIEMEQALADEMGQVEALKQEPFLTADAPHRPTPAQEVDDTAKNATVTASKSGSNERSSFIENAPPGRVDDEIDQLLREFSMARRV